MYKGQESSLTERRFWNLQQKKKEFITMINEIDIQDEEEVSEEVLLNRKELLKEFWNVATKLSLGCTKKQGPNELNEFENYR